MTLYRLVETCYENVKGRGEGRFERFYGRWRGVLDRVASCYVDCRNLQLLLRPRSVSRVRLGVPGAVPMSNTRILPVVCCEAGLDLWCVPG